MLRSISQSRLRRYIAPAGSRFFAVGDAPLRAAPAPSAAKAIISRRTSISAVFSTSDYGFIILSAISRFPQGMVWCRQPDPTPEITGAPQRPLARYDNSPVRALSCGVASIATPLSGTRKANGFFLTLGTPAIDPILDGVS